VCQFFRALAPSVELISVEYFRLNETCTVLVCLVSYRSMITLPTPKLLSSVRSLYGTASTPDLTGVGVAPLKKLRAQTAPWLKQTLVVGTLTSLALLSGVLSPLSQLTVTGALSGAVHAQSDDLIVRYAQAAYEMEQFRRRDYAEVKRIMSGNVPEDVCDRGNIPAPVQAICGRFAERFDPILRKHGLSRADFNSVHRRANDPSVQQRIQQELLKIQAR
jgi:Domain of unknown function (DUF4168)